MAKGLSYVTLDDWKVAFKALFSVDMLFVAIKMGAAYIIPFLLLLAMLIPNLSLIAELTLALLSFATFILAAGISDTIFYKAVDKKMQILNEEPPFWQTVKRLSLNVLAVILLLGFLTFILSLLIGFSSVVVRFVCASVILVILLYPLYLYYVTSLLNFSSVVVYANPDKGVLTLLSNVVKWPFEKDKVIHMISLGLEMIPLGFVIGFIAYALYMLFIFGLIFGITTIAHSPNGGINPTTMGIGAIVTAFILLAIEGFMMFIFLAVFRTVNIAAMKRKGMLKLQ